VDVKIPDAERENARFRNQWRLENKSKRGNWLIQVYFGNTVETMCLCMCLYVNCGR